MTPTADPARIADRVRFLSRVPPFKDLPADELREDRGRDPRARRAPPARPSSSRAGLPARSCTWSASARSSCVHKDAYVAVVTRRRRRRPPDAAHRPRRPSSRCGRARTRCSTASRATTPSSCSAGRRACSGWPPTSASASCRRPAPCARCPTCARCRSRRSRAASRCSATRTRRIREAAQIMIAEKRSAILVRGPGGRGIQGIVTDVDLRNKVVVEHVVAPRPRHRDHVGAGAHHRRRACSRPRPASR